MTTERRQVRIKRVDDTLPLPRHETDGSVGFDLICRVDVTIPAGEIELIPVNVIVEVPPGTMLMVASRSSLPRRKGLMIPNGVGIIDQDYRGPEDEVHVQVLNFTPETVTVERGERIAQGILVRIEQVTWTEVATVEGESRGGFGSTG
jgi:dUTP pyrophosphatase